MALKKQISYKGLEFDAYIKIIEIHANFLKSQTPEGKFPIEVWLGYYAFNSEGTPVVEGDPLYVEYFEEVLIPADSTDIRRDVYEYFKSIEEFSDAEDV